jgi:hypothetical protein
MSKAICPAGCGQKYISKEHAERHADADHPDWRIPKSKGWRTPYGFIDFREPVTYEHACSVIKQAHDKFSNAEGGQTQDIDSIGKSGVQTL